MRISQPRQEDTVPEPIDPDARPADEIADGVFRLGGLAPSDGRISWVPAGAPGLVPVNCYLVREGDEAVVIDSGVAAHRATMLRQLGEAGAGVRDITLVLTRSVEFDSIGNATAITRGFPVHTVHAHSASPEWFRFDPAFGPDERDADIASEPLRAGMEIPVDRAGRRRLDVLDAPLRLLQTSWLLDRATGTLFTSDAFSHVLLLDGAAPAVVDDGGDATSRSQVGAALEPKFGWLRDADAEPTRQAIAELFETHDIQVIAPIYGCVLRGRALVRHHVGMVLDLLAEYGQKVAA
jgi:glyoxylase-like metal-dependent hydrolase (beta-lactamase superfamily II)